LQKDGSKGEEGSVYPVEGKADCKKKGPVIHEKNLNQERRHRQDSTELRGAGWGKEEKATSKISKSLEKWTRGGKKGS